MKEAVWNIGFVCDVCFAEDKREQGEDKNTRLTN
jgi:hypothetical protein